MSRTNIFGSFLHGFFFLQKTETYSVRNIEVRLLEKIQKYLCFFQIWLPAYKTTKSLKD